MTHRQGVGVLPMAIFFLLFVMAVTDAYFLKATYQPLGYWVATWSRKYPIWLLFFVFFLGALLGHLFTKPDILDFSAWPPRLNLP